MTLPPLPNNGSSGAAESSHSRRFQGTSECPPSPGGEGRGEGGPHSTPTQSKSTSRVPLRTSVVPLASFCLSLCLSLLKVQLFAATPTSPPTLKVYRDRVEPHWLTNRPAFWYRNLLKDDTREFILADAAQGTRQPAFDHARLAEALTRLTGRDVTPDQLPVNTIEFRDEDRRLLLRGPGGPWLLDLTSYELKPEPDGDGDDDTLPFDRDIRPSRRTGPETAITFVNTFDFDVELFWLDTDGNRQSYGLLKRREERRQHTFAGHVWLVSHPGGSTLAVFEATSSPARAVLEERDPGRRRRNQDRRRIDDPTRTAVPSPDGKQEAFVRDHNLWLRETASRTESPLSFDGNPGHTFRLDVSRDRMIGLDYEKPDPTPTLPEVFWSPDSRKLIALQTRTVPERRVHLVESAPKDQLQPKLHSYPYLKPGDDIPVQTPRLFDTTTRREITVATDLFPNPWDLGRFRWTSNSAAVRLLYNQRGHQILRLLEIDATTGTVRTLIDESSPTFIDYSGKLFLEHLDASGELIWMSERSGWNHLYLYDASKGCVKNPITCGEWVVRSVDRIDSDRRQLWFRAGGIHPGQDPYHVHLARVNFDGSGLTLLTGADGDHSIQWSPDKHFFIDTWSRVDLPPVIELRRASDGTLVCQLEEADASEVLADRGRFPERFVAKGRDGSTDIHGIIHRPRDFDPARRYPVVENIYAGPHDFHVPKAFRAAYRNQQAIADRGFIVVQIDGMGTSWRSKAFHDVCWTNLADAGFPDRIAWMKAAAQRFPEMDLTRVGIYGGSAGGQSAAGALLFHGDFYKVAVADCGCHDNRMDKIWWNEQWMGWPVGPHYAEQSNVTQAHRLQGNLLLIVGELDRNVDPASTLQFANALVKAGKPFELLVMPGTGHGAAESPYASRRRLDFLVQHLRPQKPVPHDPQTEPVTARPDTP